MAVSLSKGQKVDLTKGHAGLTKILVGLGWDPNKYDGGADFDLDTAAFCCGADGKVAKDADFVFYGNLKPYPFIEHSKDDTTGGSSDKGDDEWIKIDLAKVPQTVQKIAFTVTIYKAKTRKQNFGMVSNSYVRVVDDATSEELMRYDLGEDYSTETAIVAGEIYRADGEWKFNAIGSGFKGGLAALCQNFGLDVKAEE
jgi:tellurium resistance protein TerD